MEKVCPNYITETVDTSLYLLFCQVFPKYSFDILFHMNRTHPKLVLVGLAYGLWVRHWLEQRPTALDALCGMLWGRQTLMSLFWPWMYFLEALTFTFILLKAKFISPTLMMQLSTRLATQLDF